MVDVEVVVRLLCGQNLGEDLAKFVLIARVLEAVRRFANGVEEDQSDPDGTGRR